MYLIVQHHNAVLCVCSRISSIVPHFCRVGQSLRSVHRKGLIDILLCYADVGDFIGVSVDGTVPVIQYSIQNN